MSWHIWTYTTVLHTVEYWLNSLHSSATIRGNSFLHYPIYHLFIRIISNESWVTHIHGIISSESWVKMSHGSLDEPWVIALCSYWVIFHSSTHIKRVIESCQMSHGWFDESWVMSPLFTISAFPLINSFQMSHGIMSNESWVTHTQTHICVHAYLGTHVYISTCVYIYTCTSMNEHTRTGIHAWAHTATRCNTLQRTATHNNTLQHTRTGIPMCTHTHRHACTHIHTQPHTHIHTHMYV